jgi:hypothetical protein
MARFEVLTAVIIPPQDEVKWTPETLVTHHRNTWSRNPEDLDLEIQNLFTFSPFLYCSKRNNVFLMAEV